MLKTSKPAAGTLIFLQLNFHFNKKAESTVDFSGSALERWIHFNFLYKESGRTGELFFNDLWYYKQGTEIVSHELTNYLNDGTLPGDTISSLNKVIIRVSNSCCPNKFSLFTSSRFFLD